MGSSMPVVATLALWIALIGMATLAHKKAYGHHWLDNPSCAAAMGCMGLFVLLMWAALIVYVAMKALGLVPHA